MTNLNQGSVIQYPIYKAIIPEKCKEAAIKQDASRCDITEMSLEIVGLKPLPESYILQYHCDNSAMVINNLVGFPVKNECDERKFPLDGFIIDKTFINSGHTKADLEKAEEETMPATDMCHLKNPESGKYVFSDCAKLVKGFPYTDELIGYKIFPITDENKDEIYKAFEDGGYRYKASQAAMEENIKKSNLVIEVGVTGQASAKSETVELSKENKKEEISKVQEAISKILKEASAEEQLNISNGKVIAEVDTAQSSQTWSEYFVEMAGSSLNYLTDTYNSYFQSE